jgi:hypothetical protein
MVCIKGEDADAIYVKLQMLSGSVSREPEKRFLMV